MFKKILCAVDGSDHSKRAAKVAGEMAGKFDAELVLLTVTKAVRMNDGLRRYMESEHLTGQSPQYVLDSLSKDIIKEAIDLVKETGASKVTSDVQVGQPARSIVTYADKNDVDCIVMGSRGHGDIESLLLGSVSHKVASLSNVTCVTVR